MRNYVRFLVTADSAKFTPDELKGDRFSALKSEYETNGPEPSHARYGYVHGPVDHRVFA